MNKLYQKLTNLALFRQEEKKQGFQQSHQSLWHFVQVKGCSVSSAKDFNSCQVSMRRENKSANPAFIRGSTFVSLLLDLRHLD